MLVPVAQLSTDKPTESVVPVITADLLPVIGLGVIHPDNAPTGSVPEFDFQNTIKSFMISLTITKQILIRIYDAWN